LKACIFPHFFLQNYIPLYVELYVNELANYFDKILIVTNKREIENKHKFQSAKIEILEVENEGYDFGMFYKGFQYLNAQKFDVLACINDSNVIFGKLNLVFEWASNQKVDFWGLIDANIKPDFSTHPHNYHIQSHFLVFNKPSILLLNEYFLSLNITEIFNKKTPKETRKRVINDWEIGISQYLLKRNMLAKAYFQISDSIFAEIRAKKGDEMNVSFDAYWKVIEAGVPILKKKIITTIKPKYLLTGKNYWPKLIHRFGDQSWPIKHLLGELYMIRSKYFWSKFF
jgi:hypothetical protein